MTIQEMAKTMKLASPFMAATDVSVRNRALQAVADKILEKKDAIIEANEKDLAKAKEDGIPDSVQKRLRFGDKKINDVVAGIKDLIGLEDRLNEISRLVEGYSGIAIAPNQPVIGETRCNGSDFNTLY